MSADTQCEACGQDLAFADDEFNYCPYCGAPLDPDFGNDPEYKPGNRKPKK